MLSESQSAVRKWKLSQSLRRVEEGNVEEQEERRCLGCSSGSSWGCVGWALLRILPLLSTQGSSNHSSGLGEIPDSSWAASL